MQLIVVFMIQGFVGGFQYGGGGPVLGSSTSAASFRIR